jgi:hypothetical protein
MYGKYCTLPSAIQRSWAEIRMLGRHTGPLNQMKSIAALIAAVCLQTSGLNAQDKVVLQEPNQPELLQELKAYPDGVLRVKTNEDGSFKSLVVKATVNIEDVLGAQKGKQLARQEAGIQCKKYLAQWFDDSCVFVEGSNQTVTIETKGESAKDAAGNTVKLRSQQGKESKSLTESHTSYSQAALKGLTVVSSEVSQTGQEFALIMALTQKSLNQAAVVAKALSGVTPNKPSTSGSDADRPDPETKVDRDALDDLR